MGAFENLSIYQTFPFTPKMLHGIISLSVTALICPFLNPHSNIFINFRLSTVLRQTNILVCVSVIPALKPLRRQLQSPRKHCRARACDLFKIRFEWHDTDCYKCCSNVQSLIIEHCTSLLKCKISAFAFFLCCRQFSVFEHQRKM